jgi:ATP-dependent Lon protease
MLERMIQDYTQRKRCSRTGQAFVAIMRYQAKQLAMKGKVKTNLSIEDIEKF